MQKSFTIIAILSIALAGMGAIVTAQNLDSESFVLFASTTPLVNDGATFYGKALLIKYDASGNEVFRQSIHNQVVDTGEDFLIDQTFQDGTTSADDIQMGSICISDDATPTVGETETAALFDTGNLMTENNCKEDTTVTTSGSIATIGAITFQCNAINCANGDTITMIAICQNDTTDDGDFNDCATEGVMFSVIDTSDVTLTGAETVDITYTFDITSPSN